MDGGFTSRVCCAFYHYSFDVLMNTPMCVCFRWCLRRSEGDPGPGPGPGPGLALTHTPAHARGRTHGRGRGHGIDLSLPAAGATTRRGGGVEAVRGIGGSCQKIVQLWSAAGGGGRYANMNSIWNIFQFLCQGGLEHDYI